jgi:hypothetical protein
MNTTTAGKLNKEERELKVANIQSFHEATVQNLSKGKRYLITAKAPYMYNGTRKISFFESELEPRAGGQDIYVELVHLNSYEPLDEERTLYKLRYNPHFRTEFENSSKYPALYYVSFDELEKVWQKSDEKINFLSTKEFTAPKQKAPVPDQKFPQQSIAQIDAKGFNEINPVLDLDDLPDFNITSMSIRDFAAIMWRSPVSNNPWLNELIRNIQFK